MAGLARVVTGGQTGVDRAALDAAMAAGIPVGGWCPRGRLAEDGVIPERYPLKETESADYAERTKLNVRDADGTLILHMGTIAGGTLFTKQCAEELRRPFEVVHLNGTALPADVAAWIHEQRISVLNVAGPRASQSHKIYEKAREFLQQVFAIRAQV